MLRGTAREAAAEFLGTMMLILFGCGVVAQVVLSRQTAGEYLSINLAWGLACDDGGVRRGRRLRRAFESGGDDRAGGAARLLVEQGGAAHHRAGRRRVRRRA